jgi:transposase
MHEQVIRKLRDADRMRAEQKSIAEIAKELGVSENTYHRWRNQFGGMKADDVKRLRELGRENLVDEFTREALVIKVARSITAEPTVAALQALVAERGFPQNIRCDNGPELTAHALRDWCTSASVTTSYIEPGAPARTRSRNPSTLVSVTSC